MNPAELRYELYKFLAGRPASVLSAELTDPCPADPDLTLEVTTRDYYDLANPDATRRFRVTVEEVFDQKPSAPVSRPSSPSVGNPTANAATSQEEGA